MTEINIDMAVLIEKPGLAKLMAILNADGINAKIVGGAVRDLLINYIFSKNRKIGDIDIVCKLLPEGAQQLLQAKGIKIIPTGLKHGTITALVAGQTYEITTLRRDVKTDGRHATVEYTDDWSVDATRRDFTINAFYMDMDGSIYDPFEGLSDLKAGAVRFIGKAEDRIKEDALRILRFYRFFSDFSTGDINKEGHEAAVNLKHMIPALSGERKWQELHKILKTERAAQVIKLLAVDGVLAEIIPEFESCTDFLDFMEVEKIFYLEDVLGRLACLLPRKKEPIEKMAKHLKLSNSQTKILISYADPYPDHKLDQAAIRKVIYSYGKNVVIHNLCRSGIISDDIIHYINHYDIPTFPIFGKDLIKKGFPPGKAMGAELKRLEQLWIDNDFKMSET